MSHLDNLSSDLFIYHKRYLGSETCLLILTWNYEKIFIQCWRKITDGNTKEWYISDILLISLSNYHKLNHLCKYPCRLWKCQIISLNIWSEVQCITGLISIGAYVTCQYTVLWLILLPWSTYDLICRPQNIMTASSHQDILQQGSHPIYAF